MTTPLPSFRRARPDEAPAITELAMRSKRHWGYDDAFMAALTPELTFTPEDLQRTLDHVEVLESAAELMGVFRLGGARADAYLADLFDRPRGHGPRLRPAALRARGCRWGAAGARA